MGALAETLWTLVGLWQASPCSCSKAAAGSSHCSNKVIHAGAEEDASLPEAKQKDFFIADAIPRKRGRARMQMEAMVQFRDFIKTKFKSPGDAYQQMGGTFGGTLPRQVFEMRASELGYDGDSAVVYDIFLDDDGRCTMEDFVECLRSAGKVYAPEVGLTPEALGNADDRANDPLVEQSLLMAAIAVPWHANPDTEASARELFQKSEPATSPSSSVNGDRRHALDAPEQDKFDVVVATRSKAGDEKFEPMVARRSSTNAGRPVSYGESLLRQEAAVAARRSDGAGRRGSLAMEMAKANMEEALAAERVSKRVLAASSS